MPNTALSQAIKEAYASAPNDAVILHTIELRHPAFVDGVGNPAPIRVVMDQRDWTAKLEASAPVDAGTYVDFIGYAFNLDLAPLESGAAPEVNIAIDNVSRDITNNLELAVVTPDKIEITYRPFLSNDVDGSGRLNGPQMDPPINLVMTHVQVDAVRVTARATFGDYANMKFPSEDYTPDRFPGLLR